MNGLHSSKWFPLCGFVVAAFSLLIWVWPRPDTALQLRVPGTDAAPDAAANSSNPVPAGILVAGIGQPGDLPGSWPQFRGPDRDGIAADAPRFSTDWKSKPPRELWSLDVGEGYAGVAIEAGRVYLLDYDRDARQSALRCLSLADGKEIWRYRYALSIKRNHGMTRTVPAVASNLVVALDSKCNVLCVDAQSGELKWTISLVNDFGATIPEWYAGQCPLIDGAKVILAPGGNDALLIALDLNTGKLLWQTPNPRDWDMTHSSVVKLEFGGKAQYVYCAKKGVVGVDAGSGALLWETTDWKIGIATVPSPVPLPGGRIFLTGGYGAGSLMLQISEQDGTFKAESESKLPPNVFGATQHTPILKGNQLYGVRADGRFVCLDLEGKVMWASNSQETFGLGPFLIAGDLILALDDGGKLQCFPATPSGFELLGELQVLSGRESWAPMALAGNRLLLRDLTRLGCLELPSQESLPLVFAERRQ